MPGHAAQIQGMLRAPWQWRRNDGSLWALRLGGVVALLLLGAPAIAALLWMPQNAAWVSVGGLAFLGLMIVWGVQFGALLRLDHPHAAHTVPGHPRALRSAALGLWLAMVALCGVCALLGASWLLDSGLRFALTVVVGSATLLALLAAALRWWAIWLLLSVAGAFSGVAAWRSLVLGAWGWMQTHWQAQPLAVTLLVLAVQGVLLCSLFGTGGPNHARAYASRERQRRSMAASAAGAGPSLAAYGRWGEWLGLPFQSVADAWLRHLCRHATAQRRSVMARAEVVLHGNQHWVRQVVALLAVQALVVLGFLVAMRASGADLSLLLQGGRIGISIGLTSMAVSVAMSLRGVMWMSRREQALLMLLPGMPQGATLNRAVAGCQMRHCLRTWAALLPGLALMTLAGHGMYPMALMAMVLPMSALLWGDASRQGRLRPSATFGLMLFCYAGGGLSLLLLTRQPAALVPWALAVILLSIGLLSWCWQRLGRLPQALPAGRLA